MDRERRNEICRLFKGCRYPIQQVKIVAELVGVTKHQVLRVLIEEGYLPPGTTLKRGRPGLTVQYRDPSTLPPEIACFVKGSTVDAKSVSMATGVSEQDVHRMRREEWERIRQERERRKNARRSHKPT